MNSYQSYNPQHNFLKKTKEEVIRDRILRQIEDVDEDLRYLQFLVEKKVSQKDKLTAQLPN